MKLPANFQKHLVVGSRGGRLVKWRGKVASMAPGLVVAAVAVGGINFPALAETISGSVTIPQTIGAGDDLTVTNTGSVAVSAADQAIAIAFAENYSGTLVINGSVSISVQGITENEIVEATTLRFPSTFTGNVFSSGDINVDALGGTGFSVSNSSGFSFSLIENPTIDLNSNITVEASAGARVTDVGGVVFGSTYRGSSVLNGGTVSVAVESGNGAGDGTSNRNIDEVGAIVLSGVSNAARFDNTGDLTVSAKSATRDTTSDGTTNTDIEQVAGILMVGGDVNLDAVLSNTGKISVTAGSGETTGNARVVDVAGILFEDLSAGATLNNGGVLSVEAQAGVGGNGANTSRISGIQVTGSMNGRSADGGVYSNLTNTGAISVLSRGAVSTSDTSVSDSYNASSLLTAGILLTDRGISSGNLRNSGDFNIVSVGGAGIGGTSANADASALGIRVNGNLQSNFGLPNTGSTVVNEGDLFVTATGGTVEAADFANANASAFGVSVNALRNESRVSNTGTLTIEATGGSASSITVDGASASAEARGLQVRDGTFEQGTLLENSGNLNVTATAGTADTATATAYGLSVQAIDGDVLNTGNVAATAAAISDEATSYAMYSTRIGATGSLTSTGNLTGRASGENGTGAGVYVAGEMDGTVNLSGAIRGIGPTNSYAVYLGEGGGDLNIAAPTYFVGDLVIDDQNVTLTSGKSHSVHWIFEEDQGAADGNTGSFTLVEGDDVPWFSRVLEDGRREFATFDPSGQALQDQTVARVAGFGDDAMRRNLALAMAREQGSDDGEDRSAPLAWAAIIGGTNEFSGEGAATNDFDVHAAGGIAGLALDAGRDFSFGLMAGMVSTKATSESALAKAYDIDGSSAFVGASAATNVSGLQLDAGVKFGKTMMESTRFVNYNLAIPEDGLDQAAADIDAKWAGVLFGASYDIAVNELLTITPHANISYTRAKLDGYSESGSGANATVSGRSIAVTEGEVGISVSRRIASGVVRGSLGYEARAASGPSAVSVGMIGDQNTVGIENGNYGAAKIGFGYSATAGENATLDIDGTLLSGGGDFHGQQLTASFNLRF